MGAAIVPQFGLLGDKLDISTTDTQSKAHHLLSLPEWQSHLILRFCYFISILTIMDSMLSLQLFKKIG